MTKSTQVTLKGSVVVQKKNALDLTNIGADLIDDASDFLGRKVKLQLVSEQLDPATGSGKLSTEVAIDGWYKSIDGLAAGDIKYDISFTVDKEFGTPGAFFVRNHHHNPFFLKSFSLLMPDGSTVYFTSESWIYNASKYTSPRVFFRNQVYLPEATPPGLRDIRAKELDSIRGNGTGRREEGERIYDFDVYNDLGNPDKSKDFSRPVLGGSKLPYPRRIRTGRKPAKTEKQSESLPSGLDDMYLPPDEQYGKVGYSSAVGNKIKATAHKLVPALRRFYRDMADSFESFEEIKSLYEKGIDLKGCVTPQTDEEAKKNVDSGYTLISKLTAADDTNRSMLQYPLPQTIKENDSVWMTDDEFARQCLAGLNPMVIKKMDNYPPASGLDPATYGAQASALKEDDIENQLQGLTVEQALRQNRLFILDYHDVFLPYLTKINAQKGKVTYATRTILFLREDGTLKIVAIELSLPAQGGTGQRQNRVFLPPTSGQKDWLWELAKAHVSINDAGHHQLISHWLRTHAVIEPIIISTHRQLSALHPIHLLLLPHYKNTLNINSQARQRLINAGGIIETNFTTGKHSMEMCAVVYDQMWRFDQEGLPADLIRRGMAVPNPEAEHGLELLIEDYPYAVDGLAIWDTIKSWVKEYVDIFYDDDAALLEDKELQSWWSEVRNVGHGDKKDADWWPELRTTHSLVESITTIIWLASAHHAAVNFGQYTYAGYPLNRPTTGHKLVPEEGSEEYKELQADPERFYLSALSSRVEATTVMSTLEILSTHGEEEEYLGERKTPNWTGDDRILAAFSRLKERIQESENKVIARNQAENLKNRHGEAKIAYTLLCINSKPGLTGRGVPNSVSI